jgi:hypothetical protein
LLLLFCYFVIIVELYLWPSSEEFKFSLSSHLHPYKRKLFPAEVCKAQI